jgi:hypothetical protein
VEGELRLACLDTCLGVATFRVRFAGDLEQALVFVIVGVVTQEPRRSPDLDGARSDAEVLAISNWSSMPAARNRS